MQREKRKMKSNVATKRSSFRTPNNVNQNKREGNGRVFSVTGHCVETNSEDR